MATAGQNLYQQRLANLMAMLGLDTQVGPNAEQALGSFGLARGFEQNAFPMAQDDAMTKYNARWQDRWNTQNVNAGEVAGFRSMVGSMIGGAAGAAGGAMCWVAREVYGEENPRWRLFRYWLLTQAPAWFRALYLRHGARFARWLHNKPRLKAIIRSWMNTRIATLDPRPFKSYASHCTTL